jgi:chromate reductase
MPQRRIGLFVGSLRRESFNRRLALAVARLAPSDLVFEEIRIDDLPLYCQDFDAAYPPAAARLKTEVERADALLFVTPEYNRSIPGALKNALDIGSRPWGKNSFAGKPAAVLGTSPGAIGTALAQQHLRSILAYLDVAVLGQPEVYIRFEEGLVTDQGEIGTEATRKFLQGFVDRYVQWLDRLGG